MGRVRLALQAPALAAFLVALPAQGQDGPYSVVAQQLVEEECAGATDPTVRASWNWVQARAFESRALFFSGEAGGRLRALATQLQTLAALLGQLGVAYQCPTACARHFLQAAEWATGLGQPHRARVLMQLGNQFKLQAMARWWSGLGQTGLESQVLAVAPPPPPPQRWEVRLQAEYTIAVSQLHEKLQARPLPIRKSTEKLRIEVHSICTYKPDPTSNTGMDSPLPSLSVPNHQEYAKRHGYKYVLHTELPLPDREAHYSKMLVVHEALRAPGAPDWVLFIDCDAFFTNADLSIEDLLETYAPTPRATAVGGETPGPHFLVAEDPGGVNTGIFLVRSHVWSIGFLERVSQSAFTISWDQGMFFLEIVREAVFLVDSAADFQMPPEVLLMPQAHLNAFVPPASRDWMAYEWQPGDFVRHFAGCPWQEGPCLSMMRETAEYARQQLESARTTLGFGR